MIMRSSGGGGYGDPLAREPERVRADVAFGYVCNSMRDIGLGGDPRWATLLTALRRCIEHNT